MQREIQTTADGSHTIAIPGMNVTYHSQKGAIAESRHVFISAGLDYAFAHLSHETTTVLEVGFGTGLNALLTLQHAQAKQKRVRYITLEKFPLEEAEYTLLNHGGLLQDQERFLQLHRAPWETEVEIDPFFLLHKTNTSLLDFHTEIPIDCIYFDAFAPNDQPELWTVEVFRSLFAMLSEGGVLVTYSSKTIIRKAMQEAGFAVTKLPGALGKRDMVRACKPLANEAAC